MSISFIRVDDRMIHGQTCTRWALEYPCDGLIAVNDKAATTPVLKAAYKNASDKKTFVWTLDEWRAKCGKVLASKDRYFLITKDPITMKSIPVQRPPGRDQAGQQSGDHPAGGGRTRGHYAEGLRSRVRAHQGGRHRQLEEVPRSVRLLNSIS